MTTDPTVPLSAAAPAPAALDLDRLRELEQAATPAPWRASHDDAPHLSAVWPTPTSCYTDITPADAELIAEMRNAVPSLLTELAHLTELVGKAQRHRDDAQSLADELMEQRDEMKEDLARVTAERDQLVHDRNEWESSNCELAEERDQALRDLDFQTKAAFANQADLSAARAEAEQAQARLRAIDAGNAVLADFQASIFEGRRIELTHGPCDVYSCLFPESPSPTVTMLQLRDEAVRHLERTHGAAPAVPAATDASGPAVWCNRCCELVGPDRLAEHNASEAHTSRAPRPLTVVPAATDEDAEDAPCKACGQPWRNRRHQCAAPAATDEPKATLAPLVTCGTCYGKGEHGGRDCTSCSIRAARCSNCDHFVSFHQPDGCWYAVTTGEIERDLACPCTAAAPAPAAAEPGTVRTGHDSGGDDTADTADDEWPDLDEHYDPPCGDPECNAYHCGRCHEHTGQMGHYAAICQVTGSDSDHHFCCPGNCANHAAPVGDGGNGTAEERP